MERSSIKGVEKIGKSPNHVTENVYLVNGLTYSLLSVSEIFNKGTELMFVSDGCTVSNCMFGEVFSLPKDAKIYFVDLKSVNGDEIIRLNAQSDSTDLWHRRLIHMSSSLLNKVVSKDLVCGISKLKFAENKICDTCVKGK